MAIDYDMDDEEVFNPGAASPSDAVPEILASRAKIQDPDNVVGLCSECKSTQPNSYMEKNPFAWEGAPVPCKFCGGVVVVTFAELQGDSMNTALDYNRGIGRG